MLNNIFAQDPCRIVAYDGDTPVQMSVLRENIQKLCQVLDATQQLRWVLVAQDTLNFLCAFYALLITGKDILLPPNQQAGSIAEFVKAPQALISDIPPAVDLPGINIAEVRASAQREAKPELPRINTAQCSVELCTSGSTGEPKQIRKSVATLEQELQCLDSLWGSQLNDSVLVSTVSHQHIYGLLFRVLWPLCGGYRFISRDIEYPEQLEKYAAQHGDLSLVSSPAYLKRMVEVLNRQQLGEHVNIIFSSGGPLERHTAMDCQTQLGQTPIEVLGSTETGGVAWRQQHDGNDVWHKLPPVSIRQSADNGALEVASPFVFSADWYAMGDRVELLSNTEFRLLGRLDRIVKLEEKRISLDQMEEHLRQDDYVREVRIIPVPGKRTVLGVVCVLSEQGRYKLAHDGKKALSDHLRMRLSQIFEPVTLPRKWRYLDEFPYNSQGKLTRQALLALFEDKHDDQT